MPNGRRRAADWWRRISLRCVPHEVDRRVKRFQGAMDSSSRRTISRLDSIEEEVVRGGGPSSGGLPKLVSIEDDKRLTVPALEKRVEDAEKTLVQVRRFQSTKSLSKEEAKAVGGLVRAETSFAPLSVVEPQRLNSNWDWLLGKEGGRRKSMRHLLHKRVIEVSATWLIGLLSRPLTSAVWYSR